MARCCGVACRRFRAPGNKPRCWRSTKESRRIDPGRKRGGQAQRLAPGTSALEPVGRIPVVDRRLQPLLVIFAIGDVFIPYALGCVGEFGQYRKGVVEGKGGVV